MAEERIVYNSETGEIVYDNEESRSYKLPDGFQNWWVVGSLELHSGRNYDLYNNFASGVEKINRYKQGQHKQILPVDKVAYLWETYSYFAKLANGKSIGYVEPII